jgi:hypothetical protein
MLWLLTGIVALGSSITLLMAFRAREGQVVKRPEWFDTFLAIVLTTGIGMGIMSLVAGVVQLFAVQ